MIQSLLRLREGVSVDDEAQGHRELVSAVPSCHKLDSVTTACQTDLSGEVSRHPSLRDVLMTGQLLSHLS